MKTFQTYCPNCHHIFAITESQLAFKNGLARCGHCKNIFSAIDHLSIPKEIAEKHTSHTTTQTGNIPIINKQEEFQIEPNINISRNDKQPSIKEHSTTIDTELRFDDDTGLNFVDNSQTPQPNNTSTKLTNNFDKNKADTPSSLSFDMEIIENFDDLSTTHNQIQPQNNPKEKKGNEDWLADLLIEEEHRNTSSQVFNEHLSTKNDNDITSLMNKFGVQVAPESSLKQHEYLQKISQRLQHQPTSQQIAQRKSIGMLMVWTLAILTLLTTLVVQYVVFNVESLIKNPETAQHLYQTCEMLEISCNLPSADLASIDVNVVKISNHQKQTDVLFLLTNQSEKQQLFPNLKISLVVNHSAVAQVVLTPNEYLDDPNQRLSAKQHKPFKIRLDYPRDKVEKVTIDKFY